MENTAIKKVGGLEKFQALSIATKIITLTVGVVQSVIIIRILSVQEFGLIGLVLSIGAFIGIYQHLGLQEGIIREVSIAKNKKESSKIIFTSILMRLLITLPLALGLFLLARIISVQLYHEPAVIAVLQFFSLILILQGIEGIFGAALAGLRKFKALFASQIVSAVIALVFLVIFSYFWRVPGFFWAMAISSAIMILILFYLTSKYLRENIELPRRKEFKEIFIRIFEISFIVYLARILFTFWQRMGLLVLGFFVAAYELGLFNMALVFGTKLVILSHAVSEVNLAMMTKKFSKNYEDFINTFKKNFTRVFSFVLFLSVSVIFFAREIIVYLLGDKYLPALRLIPLIMISFFIYTVIDITANSLFIPARRQRFRFYTFLIVAVVSLFSILVLLKGDKLLGTAIGLLIGIIVGAIYLIAGARQIFKVRVIDQKEVLAILFLLPIIFASFLEIGLIWKVIIYFLNAGVFIFFIQKLKITNLKNLKSLF